MTTFKSLNREDVISTRTLLHEAIPLTGSIVSGTYSDENIKNYAHGMFQSVYDYPFLSSSANHVFDITVGYSNNSTLSSSTNTQNAKKINIYNEMAQMCIGYDRTGSIQLFDEDGDITAGGTKLKECAFLNFSRLLVKDEIKKGSFSFEYSADPAFNATAATNVKRIKISDASGSQGFKSNSPLGEYGILFASSSVIAGTQVNIANETLGASTSNPPCGLIFYQAGIVVLSGSIFNSAAISGILHNTPYSSAGISLGANYGTTGFNSITGSAISASADSIRNRIFNISFNNTIELNSTIYFCRVNHNEFNYSANPTYLTGSKMRVKAERSDVPVSYATSVGLYSSDGALMAVGKLSEPLRKDPTIEYTLRARLDY